MYKALNIISRITSTFSPYSTFKQLKQIPTLQSVLTVNKLSSRFQCTNSSFSYFGSPHPVTKNICENMPPNNQLTAKRFSSLSSVNKPMLENSNSRVENFIQSRSIIKWSLDKGVKISDPEVIKRFKRLDWGIWIRPKSGAKNHLWRKKAKRINRIKQIVFCNQTQSRRLDKMELSVSLARKIKVTPFWRKPRVYPDDPYEPYLKRENFWQSRESAQEYPPRK